MSKKVKLTKWTVEAKIKGSAWLPKFYTARTKRAVNSRGAL